jgi:hypothetical protein
VTAPHPRGITAEEALAASARQIDCPIEFCVGRQIDHGGLGDEPDAWLHEGEDEPVFGVLSGSFVRIGTGPVRYAVVPALPEVAEHEAAGLLELADRLLAAAVLIEQRAHDLAEVDR